MDKTNKPFGDYLNPDGKTYNGVALFSDLTGLARAEIKWMANRLHHLMNVEKRPKNEAVTIVRRESKDEPWRH